MSQQAEPTDIKKKVLTTGIRVGTQVKTKFMKSFITQDIRKNKNCSQIYQ